MSTCVNGMLRASERRLSQQLRSGGASKTLTTSCGGSGPSPIHGRCPLCHLKAARPCQQRPVCAHRSSWSSWASSSASSSGSPHPRCRPRAPRVPRAPGLSRVDSTLRLQLHVTSVALVGGGRLLRPRFPSRKVRVQGFGFPRGFVPSNDFDGCDERGCASLILKFPCCLVWLPLSFRAVFLSSLFLGLAVRAPTCSWQLLAL